ncbi:hypothetical protein CR513_07688, partial [Mucuna pruriens]
VHKVSCRELEDFLRHGVYRHLESDPCYLQSNRLEEFQEIFLKEVLLEDVHNYKANGIARAQVGKQDHESLRYLFRRWNKVGKHYNCVKIREQSTTRDTTSHQLSRNLPMILDKDNRARVVHYKSVDPMKDKKHKKCGQHGHIVCKCKDEIVIRFNCKKQGCIKMDHPNPKREPNSKEQIWIHGNVKVNLASHNDRRGRIAVFHRRWPGTEGLVHQSVSDTSQSSLATGCYSNPDPTSARSTRCHLKHRGNTEE